MNAYLARLEAEMKGLYEQVQTLDALDTLSDAQQSDYDGLIQKLEGIKADYDRVAARSTKALSIGDALAGFAVAAPRAQRDGPPSGQQHQIEVKRFSDRVAESAEYKSNRMSDGIALGPDLLRTIIAYGHMGLKAAWVPTGIANAGGPVALFGPNTPRRRHRLLELIPTTPWGSMAVPYLAPTFTSGAAITAMGQPKPESTNAGNIASAVMQTIATWKEVPRQLLRYIAGLRQMLDDELIGAIEDELEDEIINGPGTTNHFNGLLNAVTQTGTGDDLVSATLSGIGLVEAQGGSVDGVVFNSGDYWALQALAYTDNKFSAAIQNGQFFGIPAVATGALASGTSIAGDFARGARLYDGEAANVRTAEPRAKENIVTLIAELDAVFLVGKPNYFAENTAPLVPVVGP